jgi:hypothetical protein
LHELPRPHRLCVRRGVAGRGGVLSAEAQAGDQTGFEHAALAAISFGDSSQCAVSTLAKELAPDSPTDPFDIGRAGSFATLFRY